MELEKPLGTFKLPTSITVETEAQRLDSIGSNNTALSQVTLNLSCACDRK